MTTKTNTPGQELESFYSMMDDNELDIDLGTILSNYEPKDQELAFILTFEENQALKYLKKERINTDPKRLVERFNELNANDDKLDHYSISIRKWFFCQQTRYFVKNNDAELAAKSIARLIWERYRIASLFIKHRNEARAFMSQYKTFFARLAKKRIRAQRLAHLTSILRSAGYSVESIRRKYNARSEIFNKLNNKLEKEDINRIITRDQFNKDLVFLRKHNPSDAIG